MKWFGSFFALIGLTFFSSSIATAAEDSLSFSISPTILEMSASPGQAWKTTLKVINNNPYDLTLYATPVSFVPRGEFGQGSFIPVNHSQSNGSTLAEWIKVTTEAIIIPKETSLAVPVELAVPVDATPGGHYAAVMIGTKPPSTDDKLLIKTSQIITSLFFVTVTGEVIENGEVRTFRANSRFAAIPQMDFSVRFENKGNVHLQPQGDIVIKNMWGQERGVIPINQETHFGNVLPNSIREFNFSWQGDTSFSDIGRYEATLTLGYGTNERHFTTRSAIFWVIPLKPLLVISLTLIFAVWFVTRSVRAYVRHMLKLSGIDPDILGATDSGSRYIPRAGDLKIGRRAEVRAPFTHAYALLRSRWQKVSAWRERLWTVLEFISSYRIFFASLLVFLILVGLIWYFLNAVFTPQRDYQVTIDNTDKPVVLSSEQIIADSLPAAMPAASSTDGEGQGFTLSLVNSSDTPGQAAKLADVLRSNGYRVDDLQSDFGPVKERSVVVYSPDLAETALAISKYIGNALLSAYDAETNDIDATITVFIGDDFSAKDDSE